MEQEHQEVYYADNEVANLFNVKTKTVKDKMKVRKDFQGKWFCSDGNYYIYKSFIDEIINNRLSSMSIKDTAFTISRSIDATREMLSSGRLNYFLDKWDRSIRVYKSDIDEFNGYKEKCFTADELGSYFGITANNIRKNIKYNYFDINDFVIRPHSNKIYIKKTFLDHFKEIESKSVLVEDIAKKLMIQQQDLLKLCFEYNDNIIIRDFLTGRYRIKTECIEQVKKLICVDEINKELDEKASYVGFYSLLRETAMTEEEIDSFATNECNINIYDSMQNIKIEKLIDEDIANTILQELGKYRTKQENFVFNVEDDELSTTTFFHKDEWTNPEEIAKLFGMSTIVIMRRIRENCCNVKKYIDNSQKRILVNAEIFSYLKQIAANSVLLCRAAKQIDISQESLKIKCIKLSNKSIFKDFLTGKLRIKNEFYECIKNEIEIEGNKSIKVKSYINAFNKHNKNAKRDHQNKLEENSVNIKVLLEEISMTEAELKTFLVKNLCINMDDKIKIFQDEKFISIQLHNFIRKSIHNFYLEQNYYSVNQLASIYAIPSYTVRKRIKNKNSMIDEYIFYSSNKKIYIKKDFIKYVEGINNTSILIELLSQQLGIRKNKLINACSKIGDDIVFRDFVSDKIRVKNEYVQKINDFFKSKRYDGDIQYLCLEDAAKILEASTTTVKRIISEESECDFLKSDNQIFINKNFIDEKLSLINGTLSSEKVAEILSVPRNLVLETCRFEGIKLIKNPFYCFKFRIEKDKVDKINQSRRIKDYRKRILLTELCNKAKDEFDLFEHIKESISLNLELKFTIDLFSRFTYKRIGESKSRNKGKYGIAKRCGNILQFISQTLFKDINLYSDEDINNLINKFDNSIHFKTFIAFLSYCKENTQCNFIGDYSFSEKSSKQIETYSDDIYSLEKWRKYTVYLTDIDRHISKAFENQQYACKWLLCILHLILPWRLNDIITEIPNIELEQVGVMEFKWFKDENEFSLLMGQKILQQLELKVSGINAGKNSEELRIFSSIDLIIPISIAYIIAEIHRRNNNNLQIFSEFMDERFVDEAATWVRNAMNNFFEDSELTGFANRKANTSLLTYTYECANTMEEMKSISYILEGAARSHKIDKKILLPRSTQIYLKPILHKEDAKSLAFNLVRRGFFGWIPYTLLRIAYDEDGSFENMKISDMTDDIVSLKEMYDLIGLENFANNISCELYEKTQSKVFNELLSLDKSDLKERIRSVLTYESASKSKNGGCLKGHICVYPKRKSCSCCEYFIKNIYFLATLDEEINAVMNVIDNTDEDNQYELIKNTSVLFKLMSIIGEAKMFYKDNGSDLIEAFINIKSINIRLGDIQGKLKFVK
jgi:hypothetical protein